jgi:hypothetical protein
MNKKGRTGQGLEKDLNSGWSSPDSTGQWTADAGRDQPMMSRGCLLMTSREQQLMAQHDQMMTGSRDQQLSNKESQLYAVVNKKSRGPKERIK